MKKLLLTTLISSIIATSAIAASTTNTNTTNNQTSTTATSKTTSQQPAAKSFFNRLLAKMKGSNASVGAVINTGNTDAQNLTLEIDPTYSPNPSWVYTGKFSYQFAHTYKDGITADKIYTQAQAQYNLNQHHYLYGQINYTNDKFDGYNYVFNENIGYGYRPIDAKNMTLDIFLGPGFQQNKVEETNKFSNIFSMQAGVNYIWNLTDKTNLTEQFQTNGTYQNIRSSSTTSLVTTLTDSIGFKVSLNITDDTNPAVDKAHVNTTTTISLVYNL